MSVLKRFEVVEEEDPIRESPDGDFVLYDDYADLESQLSTCKEQLEKETGFKHEQERLCQTRGEYARSMEQLFDETCEQLAEKDKECERLREVNRGLLTELHKTTQEWAGRVKTEEDIAAVERQAKHDALKLCEQALNKEEAIGTKTNNNNNKR